MQREKQDVAFLWDMLTYAREIVDEFMPGVSREVYLDATQIRRSVERSLQLIGEAAKHVSKDFREEHPEIPWRQIIGQRNVLVHEYGEIDDDLIWDLITTKLPLLIVQLDALVPGHEDPAE